MHDCAICARHVGLGISYGLVALVLATFYLLRPCRPQGLGPGEEGGVTRGGLVCLVRSACIPERLVASSKTPLSDELLVVVAGGVCHLLSVFWVEWRISASRPPAAVCVQ